MGNLQASHYRNRDDIISSHPFDHLIFDLFIQQSCTESASGQGLISTKNMVLDKIDSPLLSLLLSLSHAYTEKRPCEDPMKRWPLQVRKRGLTINQQCIWLDLGLPASKIVRK